MIELSRYVFETLRKDEEFAFCRGRRDDGELPTIFSLTPVSGHLVPGILQRLEHEYALRAELDSDWAARPLALVRREGRPMLILEDPGGEPLDRLLGRIFGFDPENAMPSYRMFLQRIHPEDRRRAEQTIDRAVRERSDFEQEYRLVLPDGSIKYVHTVGHPVVNESGVFEFIGTAMDVTDLKRAEEMRAAMARERELFAQQRATELAKANEAIRECLDALASVPELDEFLGQVMAAITRQLGAVSSMLRVRNFEQNTLPVELVFQNGRVMTPDEAKFPETWRSLSLVEQRAACFLDQPTTVTRILDPHSPLPEALRFYLLGLGVKTLLIIPLTSGGQANGQLSFRFTEERDFDPEELEIARALAIPASLAIHLTRLARTARQSAVLEERNQLAAEIHDALAQSF